MDLEAQIRQAKINRVNKMCKDMSPDKVVMDKKEFVNEHKKLINVLESSSHKDDKEEAKQQKKELKQYTQ